MRRIFIVVLIVHWACAAASAQLLVEASSISGAGFSEERLKKIDTLLQDYISEEKIAGATALVARKGQVVYYNGSGYEKEEIFRIASQTKAITSVAVMMLVEGGKILLDDPVSKYIPGFANAGVLDEFNPADSSFTTVPVRRQVTVRDLLTHTSGIGYALIGSPEAKAIYAKADIPVGFEVRPLKLADKMKVLAELPLMHQPGEKFTYGLNTDMLGYLVEVVSGKSLAAFFRQHIFDPLGMKDTWFYLPEEKQDRIAEVYMEDAEGNSVPMPPLSEAGFQKDYPIEGSTYYSGGGGLVSTAWDYSLFMQMLLNGGEYNGRRLLSPHTIRLMTSNQIGDIDLGGPDKFGLGFQVVTREGSSVAPWHEGSFSWGGYFGSLYWMDPVSGLLAIILTQESPNSEWGELSAKFKNLVYGALLE